jgi:MFS family permease
MFNIIILGIASLLTDISSEMIYPLMPLYLVTRLGASPAILGLVEGFSESLASIVKVFSGFFSDRLKKRKPFAILGYALSVVGKFLIFISATWHYVFAGRLFDRFGKGIRTAPRDAIIADSSSAQNRGSNFGLHRAMDTLGAAVGVLAAYFLITRYQAGYHRIFFISLIPAILGVAVLFAVREKAGQPRQEKELPLQKLSLKWAGLDRRLKVFLIITTVFSLGNSSNQFLLLRAKNIGFDVGTVILLYLLYNISFALFAWPISKLSDKWGRKNILVLGYIFYSAVYFGFARTNSHLFIWCLFGLYGLYSAFTEGVEKALVVDVSPENLKGTTIGLHATLVGVGLLPASLIAGLLWKFLGAAAPFYFGSALSLAAAVGLWFLI